MRTEEDKKDFVNETFSEVDLVREYWNDGTFFFVHEKIVLGGGGGHCYSHGGAKDLVDVCVHEIESSVLNPLSASVAHI